MRKSSCQATIGFPGKGPHCFTLVELLTVMAVMAILVSLILPGLRDAYRGAYMAQCVNNAHQITLAWTTYLEDENGFFVNSNPNDPGRPAWVGPGNAPSSLSLGLMWPYLSDPNAFRCPMDPTDHVRTYSLNGFLGDGVEPHWWSPIGGPRRALQQLKQTQVMIVTEENDPRGWNVGSWVGPSTYFRWMWVDPMTSFHWDGTVHGFVDGSVVRTRWSDYRTLELSDFFVQQPDNPDWEYCWTIGYDTEPYP